MSVSRPLVHRFVNGVLSLPELNSPCILITLHDDLASGLY